MKVKEIIVVEGKCDTNKIKLAVDADTIETNGAALTAETLTMIKHAHEKRGIIVFTDPDFTGNLIRNKIMREIPDVKHAFLAKKDALPTNDHESVGIEHASVAAIREALRHTHYTRRDNSTDITRNDLIRYGLIGAGHAKKRREKLCATLHIGYANGKQLLHRFKMFNVSKCELNKAMMTILERGNEHDAILYCNTDSNE